MRERATAAQPAGVDTMRDNNRQRLAHMTAGSWSHFAASYAYHENPIFALVENSSQTNCIYHFHLTSLALKRTYTDRKLIAGIRYIMALAELRTDMDVNTDVCTCHMSTTDESRTGKFDRLIWASSCFSMILMFSVV